MTKLRAPLSFEDALDRVSGAVGGKPALALRCGRKERTVRNWGDPDTPEQIPVDVALDFDLFFAEQGGVGSPFLEAFAHQREQMELARHADRIALGQQAADVIRECGEAGTLSVFRRLADGVLAQARPGDLCWVREPYFLHPQFDAHRPTSALSLGAQPTFLSQVGYARAVASLGKLRSARLLCRPWHRRHLRILRIDRQSVQDISATDIELAGYRDRFDFARNWDNGIQMRGRSANWSANPKVLRFEFELIDGPLPETVSPQRTRPSDWEPLPEHLALRLRTLSAFGSTPKEAFSPSQVERVVRIRDAVAWVLKRTWPDLTFDQLGALLEGKDHTVARIMVGRAHRRRGEDPAFKLITDDMTRGSFAEEIVQPRPRPPADRPTPEKPQILLPGVVKTPSLQPPAGRRWCEQCEQLADHARAAACTSPFCKVKPKELERA